MTAEAVREAFFSQADFCDRLGSPFTSLLCRTLAGSLDLRTRIGRRVLCWSGDPAVSRDNVPLRLCGGLHALARSGRAPELAALYPPRPMPAPTRLKKALIESLRRDSDWLDPWLDVAPQTNEVGRAAPLMAGLLVVAHRFRLPLRLFELGASAGLNLQIDRFGHELGGRHFGDPRSDVQLKPVWHGPPPPAARLEIRDRQGVDVSPMSPDRDRERLLAYIWPDQQDRLKRTASAINVARAFPVGVDQADAADWIRSALPLEPGPGAVRVVFHSIAFQYFPESTRSRVRDHIEAAVRSADLHAPLAWLRFEILPGEEAASLRLTCWPGEDRLLAWGHPHGSAVNWLCGELTGSEPDPRRPPNSR